MVNSWTENPVSQVFMSHFTFMLSPQADDFSDLPLNGNSEKATVQLVLKQKLTNNIPFKNYSYMSLFTSLMKVILIWNTKLRWALLTLQLWYSKYISPFIHQSTQITANDVQIPS